MSWNTSTYAKKKQQQWINTNSILDLRQIPFSFYSKIQTHSKSTVKSTISLPRKPSYIKSTLKPSLLWRTLPPSVRKNCSLHWLLLPSHWMLKTHSSLPLCSKTSKYASQSCNNTDLGPDSINRRLLKHLNGIMFSIHTLLLNGRLSYSYFPLSWKYSFPNQAWIQNPLTPIALSCPYQSLVNL